MRKRKSDKGTSSASIVKRNRRMDEPPSNFVSRRSLRWIPVRPLFSYTLLWSFSNRASYPWCRRRRRRRRCTFKPTKPRTARKWCIASTWARFIASYLKKLKRYSFRGEYRICVTQREERSSCRESDTRTVANIRFGNWEERPLETDRIFRVPSIFSNLFIEIYVPERIISFQHRIFFKRMGSATMLRTSRSLQVERRFEEKRERKRIQYRGNPRSFLYKSKEKKKKKFYIKYDYPERWITWLVGRWRTQLIARQRVNCRTHEHRHFERTLRSTDTIPGPRLAEGRSRNPNTACVAYWLFFVHLILFSFFL